MYGERYVREAFDPCGEADKQFLIAFMAWRKGCCPELEDRSRGGPRSRTVDGAEPVRLRKAVESVRDTADAKEEAFVQAVAKAVGRLPGYKRGSWRRSKTAPGV
jgi:hypothetical protein